MVTVSLTAIMGAILGLVVLASLVAGFFMYVAAKLAMVEKATFGRAILAALGSSLADWVLTAALSPVPLLGSCSGFVIGLAASLVIIMLVFETTVPKALLVWLFHLLAELVALFIAVLTFASILLSFLSLPLLPIR